MSGCALRVRSKVGFVLLVFRERDGKRVTGAEFFMVGSTP
jgi:hypothetical protein